MEKRGYQVARRIMQWVPIEGTRWRNEVANGHENHAVGFHYGVAPGGDVVSLCELPNTAAFPGFCGRGHGGPGFHSSSNTKSSLTMASITDPTPRGESL